MFGTTPQLIFEMLTKKNAARPPFIRCSSAARNYTVTYRIIMGYRQISVNNPDEFLTLNGASIVN